MLTHIMTFGNCLCSRHSLCPKRQIKKLEDGNSLAVQWLELGAFTARAQVQSLVRELRSCKPLQCGQIK